MSRAAVPALSAVRSRLAARWARFDGTGRAAGIDLARGLAVIGMFAAHLVATRPLVWSDPSTWSGIVNGRPSILFATLAGVSLALSTGGPDGPRRLGLAQASVAIRALWIWVLGVALIGLGTPAIVILPAYAILFLLSLPLLRWRPAALFALAGVIALAMPFVVTWVNRLPAWQSAAGQTVDLLTGWNYPFLLWAAFVAAGLGIGRLRFTRPLTATALLGAGAVLAAIGDGLVGRWARTLPADGALRIALSDEPHSSGMGEAVGSGGFAIAVIAACVLLCLTPARWVALPLRAVGAMPLTAYTAQLIAWAVLQPPAGPVGDELSAFRALEPFWPLTLATIAGCTLWTLLVGRGPLEAGIAWFVRTVTTSPGRPARTP